MCKCTPEIRTPFCGKIGCEWPQDIKDQFDRASSEASEAAEKMKEAMRVTPELFDRVDELLKQQSCIQTPIITTDGELIVLYSSDPFDNEEMQELKKLTSKELHLLMKINNFRTYKL